MSKSKLDLQKKKVGVSYKSKTFFQIEMFVNLVWDESGGERVPLIKYILRETVQKTGQGSHPIYSNYCKSKLDLQKTRVGVSYKSKKTFFDVEHSTARQLPDNCPKPNSNKGKIQVCLYHSNTKKGIHRPQTFQIYEN